LAELAGKVFDCDAAMVETISEAIALLILPVLIKQVAENDMARSHS
jgi:hypothetical protein